jgi:hypothetical protein
MLPPPLPGPPCQPPGHLLINLSSNEYHSPRSQAIEIKGYLRYETRSPPAGAARARTVRAGPPTLAPRGSGLSTRCFALIKPLTSPWSDRDYQRSPLPLPSWFRSPLTTMSGRDSKGECMAENGGPSNTATGSLPPSRAIVPVRPLGSRRRYRLTGPRRSDRWTLPAISAGGALHRCDIPRIGHRSVAGESAGCSGATERRRTPRRGTVRPARAAGRHTPAHRHRPSE